MDKLGFISMTGAQETMRAQAIHANNLANLKTPGFRADLAQSRSFSVYGDGFPSRAYVGAENNGTKFSNGGVEQTGNPFHMLIENDNGFFAVLGRDGTESYSRQGDFFLNQNNELVNGKGDFLLGTGEIPIIIPPAQSVSISQTGTVSYVPLNADPTTSLTIDQIKTVSSDLQNLRKQQDGNFKNANGTPLEYDPNIRVKQGLLEGSNVDAVSEIIDIMALARNHELNIKMISEEQENDEQMMMILRLE